MELKKYLTAKLKLVENGFYLAVRQNMKRTTKILLTIPSILGLSYMVTFIFPVEFHWLVPTMKAYYIQI